MIKRMAIIGYGNVGSFLARRFEEKGLEVIRFSRKARKEECASQEDYDGDFDLSLITVPDDSIEALSASLSVTRGIMAHSSGTVSIEAIHPKHGRSAIFYPLMSIKSDSSFDLDTIPFCLEAKNEKDVDELRSFAQRIQLNYRFLNSSERAKIHLAAVISQNFSNHLYHWAWNTLKEENIDFEILKPLLLQHLKGLESQVDPALKQTGPAVRGDQQTIKNHLKQIKEPSYQALYKSLSDLIQKTHEEKL